MCFCWMLWHQNCDITAMVFLINHQATFSASIKCFFIPCRCYVDKCCCAKMLTSQLWFFCVNQWATFRASIRHFSFQVDVILLNVMAPKLWYHNYDFLSVPQSYFLSRHYTFFIPCICYWDNCCRTRTLTSQLWFLVWTSQPLFEWSFGIFHSR